MELILTEERLFELLKEEPLYTIIEGNSLDDQGDEHSALIIRNRIAIGKIPRESKASLLLERVHKASSEWDFNFLQSVPLRHGPLCGQYHYVTINAEPCVSFDDEVWKRFEDVANVTFSSQHRTQIQKALESYLIFKNSASASTTDVRPFLEKISKLSQDLTALENKHGLNARETVISHIKRYSPPTRDYDFEQYFDYITTLGLCADKALKNLNTRKKSHLYLLPDLIWVLNDILADAGAAHPTSPSVIGFMKIILHSSGVHQLDTDDAFVYWQKKASTKKKHNQKRNHINDGKFPKTTPRYGGLFHGVLEN